MLVSKRKCAENTFFMEEPTGPVKQQQMGWICNCSTRILGILLVFVCHSIAKSSQSTT
jgi:hypothetical protein